MNEKRKQLLTGIISCCLIHGALSALTKRPENVIIQKGDDIYMECSTDAYAGINTITWAHDAADFTRLPCRIIEASSDRFNVTSSTTNDCHIVAVGTSNIGNQGPYTCKDGSGVTAQAVAVLIENPTCVVSTSPPIRGQNVTLSCSISYIRKGDEGRLNPGAILLASVSWDAAAGTFIAGSNISTSLPNDAGEILQVDVQRVANEVEIPSYDCTTSFHFLNKSSAQFVYALNSLSWTCSSKPVLTWYCPATVTVTPAGGTFKTGDVLTCKADGYPAPSYTWTDSNGAVLSTTSSAKILNPGAFNWTCTATGNFTTPCSASHSVIGNVSGDPVSTVPTTAVMTMMTTEMPGNDTETNGGTGGLTTTMVIGIAVGVGALILGGLLAGLITWLFRRKMKVPTEGKPQKSAAFYQAVRGRPPSRFMANRPWMMDAYRRRFIDNYNHGQYSDCGKCYTPSSYDHKNVYVKNCDIGNRCAPSQDGQGVYDIDNDYGKSTAPSYTQKSVPMSPVFF